MLKGAFSMYKRLSAVLFPIMTIMFIGAMYWGYQEHQEKNTVLLKAENQYQRAFGDLTYYVNELNDQLGNTLAVNSTSMDYHRKGLVNVWRITSEAQNQISQLPLSYLPFVDAENFLSRVSNFAYKTAVRDLTKQPLSEDEFSTLKALYSNSKEISTGLLDLQQKIMNSKMRWMDVEVALAVNEADTLNPVVSSLRGVNDGVNAYPELNWGPAVNSMYTDEKFEALSGSFVNAEEVKQLASKFTNIDSASFNIAENGKDSDYSTFTATAKSNNDDEVKLTFTAKGGQLLSYVHNREIKSSTLSIDDAKDKAEQFLEEHGYNDMEAVSYDAYEHVGTFSFVYDANNVLVYPDKINIKVALDDGEILGFQGSEYVSHHQERKIERPTIGLAEAKKALNPNLKVRDQKLAIIKGELGAEVLCYEFTGSINNSLYRIYINSETGLEETIEQMSKEDQKATD